MEKDWLLYHARQIPSPDSHHHATQRVSNIDNVL